MFEILRSFHEKGFAHGHLKPRVFQFGTGIKANTLYFNDFMDYCTYNRKGRHVTREKPKKRTTKINQFMSFDRMQGYEISRRDDIESILNILVFLFRGELPWSRHFKEIEAVKLLAEEAERVPEQSLSHEKTKEETMKLVKEGVS